MATFLPQLCAAQQVVRQEKIGHTTYNVVRYEDGTEDYEEAGPIVVTDAMLTKGTPHNGHNYVDLGLNVYWATCNVAASDPSQPGILVKWGETEPGSDDAKASLNHKRYYDLKVKGDPKFDAARKVMGGKWRLPSKMEVQWLVVKCIWEPAVYKGVEGAYIKSKKNGNSIFIPFDKCSNLWTYEWGGGDDGDEGCCYGWNGYEPRQDIESNAYELMVRGVLDKQ